MKNSLMHLNLRLNLHMVTISFLAGIGIETMYDLGGYWTYASYVGMFWGAVSLGMLYLPWYSRKHDKDLKALLTCPNIARTETFILSTTKDIAWDLENGVLYLLDTPKSQLFVHSVSPYWKIQAGMMGRRLLKNRLVK